MVSVPPKRVRFRMLNGSQARFYHLNLYPEESATPGEAKVGTPGPVMYQVGTEGGFLPAVAIHDNTTPIPLDLETDPEEHGQSRRALQPASGPGGARRRRHRLQRRAGRLTFILYNDAPAPFPGGDPRNDYFTGDPDQTAFGGAPTTLPGHGPNTRTL